MAEMRQTVKLGSKSVGDGQQTRSFLYIDECLEGVERFMEHPQFMGPVNVGSGERVNIGKLVGMVAEISGKNVKKKHINRPLGVRGRNSHNELIEAKLSWSPSRPLYDGMEKTYKWVEDQVKKQILEKKTL